MRSVLTQKIAVFNCWRFNSWVDETEHFTILNVSNRDRRRKSTDTYSAFDLVSIPEYSTFKESEIFRKTFRKYLDPPKPDLFFQF